MIEANASRDRDSRAPNMLSIQQPHTAEPDQHSLPRQPASKPPSEQPSEIDEDDFAHTTRGITENEHGAIEYGVTISEGSARTAGVDTEGCSRLLFAQSDKVKKEDDWAAAAPPLPERPKVIYRNSARQFLKLQLPSIILTVALLVLYALNVSFQATSSQIAGLLFAAKFHEGLITISLIDMVYYHIRRRLLGRDGISYGLLQTPFQMTSPMFLFTSELWSGIWSTRANSIMMSSLIILALTLASVVGASSGNIMLPKPVWGTYHFMDSLSISVVSSPSDMYPSQAVERLNESNSACEGNPQYCPYSKLSDPQVPIYTWMTDTSVFDQRRNISIASDDPRDVMLYRRYKGTAPPVLTGTVTPSCVANNLLRNRDEVVAEFKNGMWPAEDHKSVRFVALTSETRGNDPTIVRQPRITGSCFRNTFRSNSHYEFEMPSGFYPNFTLKVPAELFADARTGSANFGVININDLLHGDTKSSLTLWTRSAADNRIFGLCLFDARWIDGRHWIYPRDPGARVLNELSQPINNDVYTALDQSMQVEIDKTWFYSLNTSLSSENANYSPPKGVTHAFDLLDYYIFDPSSHESYYGRDNARFASAWTVLLTTALAEIPCQNGFSYTKQSDRGSFYRDNHENGTDESLPSSFSDLKSIDPQKFVVLSKVLHEMNYGYSFNEGVTKLSWVPLLVHLLLVAIHLGILVKNHGQGTTRAWGTLGEFVTLAMNTQPPDVLRNTSAGVKDQSLWGLNTVVRQVDGMEGEGGVGGRGGKIEFVLRDRRKYGRVGQDDGQGGEEGEDGDGVILLDRLRRFG